MSLPSEVAPGSGPATEEDRVRRGPGLLGLEALAGAEGFAAPGAGGRRRTAISSYLIGWLTAHWTEATDGAPSSGAALVVLGSVGRGDAGPRSDVDLVILHDARARSTENINALAQRLLYPLWDSGIRIDHSVRTLRQCRDVAAGDLAAAVGLLDLAHVAGDPELSAAVRSCLHHDWRKAARTRLPDLVESMRARHARFGDLAQSIEPDLKEARGGLRDVTVARSLVTAWLADQPHGLLDDATDLLLDVRDAVQVASGRPRPRLIRDLHDDVATLLGIDDRDELLTRVSSAGRTIAYGLDGTLRRAGQSQRARTLRVGPRRPQLNPLGHGCFEHDGELVLGPRGMAARPAAALQGAVVAAQAGIPISPSTLDTMAQRSGHVPEPWNAETRALFTDLLATGEGLLPVWEGLDQVGLISWLLPEWTGVRSRPQRSPIHRHTVDRHLLETVVHAGRLCRRVARPDLLLLAALLHDIGKVPAATDHSYTGGQLTVDIMERMGYADRERDLVVACVLEHLTLIDLATGRDPAAAETIEAAYAVVGGDHELAELLIALTEADARAAGPGAWSAHRQTLFAQLVAGLRERLGPARPTEVRDLVEGGVAYHPVDEATRARALGGEPVITVVAAGSGYRIDVIAPDRSRLFADCASALAVSGLSVRTAVIRTLADVVVNSWVVDARDGEPDVDRVRRSLRRLVDGEAPTRSAPRRTGGVGALKPYVQLHPDVVRGGVTLEVRCTDRPGLLADLGYAVTRAGFEIRSADVRTYAGQARDVLLVRPVVGSATSAGVEAMLDAVRAACG